ITALHAERVLDKIGAAAEQQIGAAKDMARRPLAQMMDEQIERGLPVRADHLPGDRDEFGGAGAGAGTRREKRNAPRPAAIVEQRKGRVPVGRPEILVTPQRYRHLKRFAVADPREAVLLPEAGRGGAPEKPPQRRLLYRDRTLMGEPTRPETGVEPQQRRGADHRGAGSSRVTYGKRARASAGASGPVTYSPRRNSSAWSRKAALPGTPS